MVEAKDEKDINDIFEDILFSEEKIIEKSYEEGYNVGITQENVEAYHLGYHRGAEIGAELGYYTSFVDYYSNFIREKGVIVPDKISRIISTIKELLDKFPQNNDENTDLKYSLDNIRVKFKLLCSLLKINGNFSEIRSLTF